MKKVFKIILPILVLGFAFTCLYARFPVFSEMGQLTNMVVVVLKGDTDFLNQVSVSKEGRANTIFEIRDSFDLNGETVDIPRNCVLRFRGGSLNNGTLVGDGTKIDASDSVFSSIIIAGDWLVSKIESRWFSDITKDNVIKNLVALSSDVIDNTIVVEKGDYEVSVSADKPYVLELKSNTTFNLEGRILLAATDNGMYSVIRVDEADHVAITGTGTIVGDKDMHLSTKFRSGHLISVERADDVLVRGLTLMKPWGDCVLIGNRGAIPTRVVIEGCTMIDGRRQGISIGSGENIIIRNCTIDRVSESSTELVGEVGPCAGIDVENIDGLPIRNIRISDIKVNDAKLGLCIYNDNAPGDGVCEEVFVSGYMATNCYDKGLYLGYNVKNITVEGSEFEADVSPFYGFSLFDEDSHKYSQISEQTNIVIRNSSFRFSDRQSAKGAFCMYGRHPNVSFNGCSFDEVKPSSWRVFAGASGCSFVNCRVNISNVDVYESAEIMQSTINCSRIRDAAEKTRYLDNSIVCNSVGSSPSFTCERSGSVLNNNDIYATVQLVSPERVENNRFYPYEKATSLTSLLFVSGEGGIVQKNSFGFREAKSSKQHIKYLLHVADESKDMIIKDNVFDLRNVNVGIHQGKNANHTIIDNRPRNQEAGQGVLMD